MASRSSSGRSANPAWQLADSMPGLEHGEDDDDDVRCLCSARTAHCPAHGVRTTHPAQRKSPRSGSPRAHRRGGARSRGLPPPRAEVGACRKHRLRVSARSTPRPSRPVLRTKAEMRFVHDHDTMSPRGQIIHLKFSRPAHHDSSQSLNHVRFHLCIYKEVICMAAS